MSAWAWLALAWLALAIAWLAPRVGLWWRLRQMRAVWQAREDMEAALWAECTADAAASATQTQGKPAATVAAGKPLVSLGAAE